MLVAYCLLVPVHDPPATQVVGAELHNHPVVRQDADVVHPHFPADMSENLVPVVQLHPEEGIRERLDNRAFDLNGAVFLGHVLRVSLYDVARAVARSGLVVLVWAAGLPFWARMRFLSMRVGDLLGPAERYLVAPFVTQLPAEKNFELASTTALIARKPR